MVRLALVMIARNEARAIARALESARPHVDSMILLDTGSTDETVAIAERCGATVHNFAWCDDFAAARNAALDHSDADWNLVLDADEWLDGGFEALSPAALPSAQSAPAAFIGCPQLRNEGTSSVARRFLPRLLPRGVRYVGRIHEQPVSPLPLVPCALRIGHDGYAEAQLAAKHGRNLALLQAALAEAPEDCYLWYQLGREHLVRGAAEAAVEPLQTAYRLTPPAATYRHAVVLSNIRALKEAGRLHDALALVDAEQTAWPKSPDFYFAVADLYLEWASHAPELAIDELLPVVEGAWLRCLEIGEQPLLDGSVIGCGSYLAAGNLAMFYERLGILDQAERYAALERELLAAA
ncbi:glycosyltransferase family 2 protein [uncultured Sphingomonas sp.]|uniref:glycosyltransferase family 2 protein n=1 Tax=uncultured Sphingomonas sp. TaxID=158754 RepID=UPI0025D20976|nr:glycosyltransferase family 2 protein [uncultured Sphingomonas sp.]